MRHLAQYNIGRALAPLNDPRMSGFVQAIAQVNEAAEASPGFVWRLKDESGGSSSYVRAYEDELQLVNLSVWESLETLRAFVQSKIHLDAFRRRRAWFEPHS